jgi:hypothetical protein
MRQKLAVPAVVTALALAAAPTPAAADGLPSGTNADPGGITTPALASNFIAVPAGRGTLVGRVHKRTGRLENSTFLADPAYVMPAVALDGTPGGLSAGGDTLVLIRQRARFPQDRTELAVLDGGTLLERSTIDLRGDFSYDAISPDGRRLYLIQYTSRRDVTEYAVRSYDLVGKRLEPGRIVDAREPDEDMSGFPLTRATSAHGRWAYTLYDGTEHPFVHALDTVGRRAFCIDLDLVTKDQLVDMRLDLAPDGRTLTVKQKGTPLAEIDTRAFTVSKPGARAATLGDTSDDGSPVVPILVVAGLALLLGGAVLQRRRRVLTGV